MPAKYQIHTPKSTDAEVEEEDGEISDTPPVNPLKEEKKEEKIKKENLYKTAPKFAPKKRAKTELERRERVKKEFQELVQQEFAEAPSDSSWMETTSTGLKRQ